MSVRGSLSSIFLLLAMGACSSAGGAASASDAGPVQSSSSDAAPTNDVTTANGTDANAGTDSPLRTDADLLPEAGDASEPTEGGPQTTCTKHVYVHIVAYGYTDYAMIFNAKNSCWGLEAPKYTGGAAWVICSYDKTNPSGGTRWAYDDVNIGTAGHTDASQILDCKSKNGNAADTVYVAANSGANNDWSHAGITGAAQFFNECYDSDLAMDNRNAGCSVNGNPMWNIGASTHAYQDTLSLCNSRSAGEWLGIYAGTVGLSGKESSIVTALNYCTTH